MRFSLILATLALSAVASFAQTPVFPGTTNDAFYQLGFAANLNIGDSVVNLTNDGYNGGVFPNTLGVGNLCINAYVFDPREEEIGCCSCLVTPNGLNSLSAKADLISNNLTPDVPTSIVIKLLASAPAAAAAAAGGAFTVCNPATAGTTALTPLEYGMVAWGSTLEPSATTGTYSTINVPFAQGAMAGITPNVGLVTSGFVRLPVVAGGVIIPTTLGVPPVAGTELAALTSLCNFIQANGSNFGICRSCRLGALGGARQ